MRFILSASLVLGLLTAPALVTTASADSMKSCAANWKAMSKADQSKTTYKAYSTTCLKSGSAPAAAAPAPAMAMAPAKPTSAMKPAAMAMPAVGAVPAGATGLCGDGTYTMSKTHSGACSHHKGVSKWL